MANTTRIRVARAENGSSMTAMFSSLGSFGTTLGGHNATDYLSQRSLAPGTQGWSTHNLFPPQDPLSGVDNLFGREALYVGEPTDDLSKAVFRSYSSLPGTPEGVELVSNLYLRSDLRQQGPGAYQLLTGCSYACLLGENRTGSRFAGGSEDLSKILIASPFRLTEDATSEASSVFKVSNGTLTNVAYVPVPPEISCTGVETGCIAAANAIPGSAEAPRHYASHTISADGSKVFFKAPPYEGSVYMRDDQGTQEVDDDVTVKINASELAGPAFESNATFWDATPDGKHVLFTSYASLTGDAQAGGGEMLYRWSLTPDADGNHLTYLSEDQEPADAVGRVYGALGISDDGRTVYFLQAGQIVADAPQLDFKTGIYAWREGVGARYIGEMRDDADIRFDLKGTSHDLESSPELGARVTPNGNRLLISLHQPPSKGGPDHGHCPGEGGSEVEGKQGCKQLYLYDALAASPPVCVSCGNADALPSTSAFYSVVTLGALSASTDYLNHPMSDDGRYVFFSTGEDLINADTNGKVDAYLFDSAIGTQHLLSSGTSKSPSYFVDASASGKDAFFITRERLSAWDYDSNQDIYDARVEGGVPEPPAAPIECQGDSCHPLPVIVGDSVPDSLSHVGKGSAGKAKHRGCRKQRRRAHRRGCVRKDRRWSRRGRVSR